MAKNLPSIRFDLYTTSQPEKTRPLSPSPLLKFFTKLLMAEISSGVQLRASGTPFIPRTNPRSSRPGNEMTGKGPPRRVTRLPGWFREGSVKYPGPTQSPGSAAHVEFGIDVWACASCRIPHSSGLSFEWSLKDLMESRQCCAACMYSSRASRDRYHFRSHACCWKYSDGLRLFACSFGVAQRTFPGS